MSQTMKVVVKDQKKPGVSLQRKPIPYDLEHDEALVKIKATSICGTDLHIYRYDEWSQKRLKLPFTMGHEFCGEVVQIGSHVKQVSVGDIVSAETHIVCGVCEFCRRGEAHICSETQIIGVDTDGAFAEYIKMPAVNLIVNDPNVDPRYLSIQEPLGNALHTMLHFDIIGKTVAVVGCGPLGLMGVNIAKAVGAKKIIAIDVKPYRRQKALDLGADIIIDPLTEDVISRVLEETDGKGVDVVGEFSGNALAIQQAFKYIKHGGKMSMLGIPNEHVSIDVANDIVFKGISIYGVVGRRMYETWDQVSGIIATNKLDFDKIITHTFKLEEIDEAVALIETGETGKVVLIP